MMASERRTVKQEREEFRAHQEHEVEEKLRRFRDGLMRARYDADDIQRLERAYEKRLRGNDD